MHGMTVHQEIQLASLSLSLLFSHLQPVESCLHLVRIVFPESVPDERECLQSFLVSLVGEDSPKSEQTR